MHVACLLLSWCVVAHVLLLFPREKPLGINMVSVDVCMSTCGRCGTAFVYWLGSSRGSDCLVASALPYQYLHTFYVVLLTEYVL
jgi:hypothetical protein